MAFQQACCLSWQRVPGMGFLHNTMGLADKLGVSSSERGARLGGVCMHRVIHTMCG